MRLMILGTQGMRSCSWATYALLRDNVQHYIEGGLPSERFRALHDLERAVDEGVVRIDAARLRGEVLRARCVLEQLQLGRAAVSVRTRAVLTGSRNRPRARDTVLASAAGWALPLEGCAEPSVAAAARQFVDAVLLLTASAVDGAELEVRCTASPRYETRSVERAPLPRRASQRPMPPPLPRRDPQLAARRLPPPLPRRSVAPAPAPAPELAS